MCGLVGIYAYHPGAPDVDRAEVIRIRDYMEARGPDGKGEWFSADGRVGFGHRRLSIIDLTERGAQPMQTPDGGFVVNFNGEIYNYRELRSELERQGYAFRSDSDTEVLLHLHAAHGVDMVRKLRGMFAFSIWDRNRNELLLYRDPFGIKPLYYANDGVTVRFASQVKALIAGGHISRDPDPAGQVGFYLFGSVPEPFTIYRSVRAVPAGSFVRVDRLGVHAPIRYHSIAAVYRGAAQQAEPAQSVASLQTYLREALLDSVRHHLVSDVPVGAFLSGGIDSTALVGLMLDAGQRDIQTVTLAFEEFKGQSDDEAPLAAKASRLYGTKHSTRMVTEAEFWSDLPRILRAMDQPTIDGINTWFVSKAAHEFNLKVAVSGLGGDELFGGYPSFQDIPRLVRFLGAASWVPFLGLGVRDAIRGLPARAFGINPKVAGLIEYGGTYAGAYLLRRGVFMPWELDVLLGADLAREGLRQLDPLNRIASALVPDPEEPFARVAALEASLYMRNQLLRDTDWASMAHSLEVRVPLVDATLLTKLGGLTASSGRGGMKSFLADAPSRPAPRETFERRKTGFSVPISRWMGKDGPMAEWRRVPMLRESRCHWSRRWAYAVAQAA